MTVKQSDTCEAATSPKKRDDGIEALKADMQILKWMAAASLMLTIATLVLFCHASL